MFSQTYLQNFFFSFFFYRKQNVWFVTNLMWGLIVQIKNSMTKLTLTKLQRWHLLFLLNKDFFFFFFGSQVISFLRKENPRKKKRDVQSTVSFSKKKVRLWLQSWLIWEQKWNPNKQKSPNQTTIWTWWAHWLHIPFSFS